GGGRFGLVPPSPGPGPGGGGAGAGGLVGGRVARGGRTGRWLGGGHPVARRAHGGRRPRPASHLRRPGGGGRGRVSPDEVVDACRSAGVRLVRFLYCDNGGVVRGKATTLDRLAERMASGIGLTVAMSA